MTRTPWYRPRNIPMQNRSSFSRHAAQTVQRSKPVESGHVIFPRSGASRLQRISNLQRTASTRASPTTPHGLTPRRRRPPEATSPSGGASATGPANPGRPAQAFSACRPGPPDSVCHTRPVSRHRLGPLRSRQPRAIAKPDKNRRVGGRRPYGRRRRRRRRGAA